MNEKQDFRETVAVLFGGRSVEHEISIITALQAIHAMDPYRYNIVPVYVAPSGKWYCGEALLNKSFYKQMPKSFKHVEECIISPDPSVGGLITKKGVKKIDICFLTFHGQFGEDGCIQGLLELANIPYTGCGVASSALVMDKYLCKLYLKAHEVPVLPSITIQREHALTDLSKVQKQIQQTEGLERFPLFVKPCHLGSSVGIGIATDERTLNAAIVKAFQYDDTIIVEPCVQNLTEINVAVLEGNPPLASVVEIPISATGQGLSYEDKYLRGGNKRSNSQGMACLSRVIDPPDLNVQIKNQAIQYGIQAFSLLQCGGVARIDFILDHSSGQLYFNELNPIPGSLAFYLWEKCNPPLLYTQLLNHLLEHAKKRKRSQLSLKRDFGFQAL